MTPAVSICSLTNVAPARVAATLAPLASLDAEVVLAVDDRVPEAWVDGYRELADVVIRVAFPGAFNRLYAWLCDQCSGTWVLQLDADEVPAPGLAAELAGVMADGDVSHAWVRRRWLYPGPERVLAQWPWRPDWSLRAFRNDGTTARFPGMTHAPVAAAGPRRHLSEPIYHADLLVQDVEARRRKVQRYDEARPGLRMEGRPFNAAYYLPELRAHIATEPVPDGDRAVVAAFMDQVPHRSTGGRAGLLRRAGADEVLASWEQRPVAEDAYDAAVTLLDDDLRITRGELRTYDVEVHNRGPETWPGGEERHPLVRLGVRWVDGAGQVVDEGMRTPLPGPVRPGQRVVVPLMVQASTVLPEATEVEVALVHEHVRWFGDAVRVELAVE